MTGTVNETDVRVDSRYDRMSLQESKGTRLQLTNGSRRGGRGRQVTNRGGGRPIAVVASCGIDVRLRVCLEVKATVLECPYDLALRFGWDNDVIREIGGNEENGTVSVR